MLTDAQIKLLEKPFELNEHAFVNGNPYIKKSALRRRLYQVDPHWTPTPPEYVEVINNVVIFRAGLTIGGETRYSVGTGIIIAHSVDKNTGEIHDLLPYDVSRNTAKAIKTADSDLLPRCAGEFNVGAYLKDMTKAERDTVRDMNALKTFLDKLNKPATSPHWAMNGGGQRINNKIKTLKLDPAYVLEHAEADRKLTKLSDTTLTEDQFSVRLDEMAAALKTPAGGSESTTPKSETQPIPA
jgi:hypothetical protein